MLHGISASARGGNTREKGSVVDLVFEETSNKLLSILGQRNESGGTFNSEERGTPVKPGGWSREARA